MHQGTQSRRSPEHKTLCRKFCGYCININTKNNYRKTGSPDARTGAEWLNISCKHPNFSSRNSDSVSTEWSEFKCSLSRGVLQKMLIENPKTLSRNSNICARGRHRQLPNTSQKFYSCFTCFNSR
jgi:hypothetical protein